MIGKKRKLIVPVVAIMMCAVALAGVAYAYSSSVSNTGTNDQDYAVLIFTNQSGTEQTSGSLAALTGITFTTVTTINPTAHVTVNADGTATFGVYFKYVSDKDAAYYTVAEDFKLLKDGNPTTTVEITAQDVDAQHKSVSFAIGNMVLRNSTDTADAPATLVKDTVYLAKITVTPTCDVQFNNATAVADATAVVNAINALTYSFTLTSTDAPAPQQP